MAFYPNTGAFSILLIGAGPPISLFIFGCYLLGREIPFSQAPQRSWRPAYGRVVSPRRFNNNGHAATF